MQTFMQDFRYVLRQLRVSQTFTATTILPALLASLFPAHRAASVEPVEELRAE